jgi:hypothetical protein
MVLENLHFVNLILSGSIITHNSVRKMQNGSTENAPREVRDCLLVLLRAAIEGGILVLEVRREREREREKERENEREIVS